MADSLLNADASGFQAGAGFRGQLRLTGPGRTVGQAQMHHVEIMEGIVSDLRRSQMKNRGQPGRKCNGWRRQLHQTFTHFFPPNKTDRVTRREKQPFNCHSFQSNWCVGRTGWTFLFFLVLSESPNLSESCHSRGFNHVTVYVSLILLPVCPARHQTDARGFIVQQ